MTGTLTIVLLLSVIIGMPLYFAPSIVAFRRYNKNRVPLLLVNLVLGWALFGAVWAGCMIWACIDPKEAHRENY